jgi:hypothetical protein
MTIHNDTDYVILVDRLEEYLQRTTLENPIRYYFLLSDSEWDELNKRHREKYNAKSQDEGSRSGIEDTRPDSRFTGE